MVGACVVQGRKLVGSGFHERYGGNHAEVNALKAAGKKARGATLYVTLEPCATWGKTPPCAAAILKSGIREVVIATLDPNPKNHGKGIAALKKEGILVRSGVLEKEACRQNEAFFKYTRQRLPFVTLKMAQSLDGKIAARTGHSRWISSPKAREFVHALRAEQDAILVGANTFYQDNPMLSPRLKNLSVPEGKPWRVVVGGSKPINTRARIFKGKQLTLFAVSSKKIKSFGKDSGRIFLPVSEKNGRLDLRELLKYLATLGVAKVLVEGGGELAWSFVSEKLVDRFYWVVAPKMIGGRGAKTSLEGHGVAKASQAFDLEVTGLSKIGCDYLFEGKFK